MANIEWFILISSQWVDIIVHYDDIFSITEDCAIIFRLDLYCTESECTAIKIPISGYYQDRNFVSKYLLFSFSRNGCMSYNQEM